jgi:hypothetical protein
VTVQGVFFELSKGFAAYFQDFFGGFSGCFEEFLLF